MKTANTIDNINNLFDIYCWKFKNHSTGLIKYDMLFKQNIITSMQFYWHYKVKFIYRIYKVKFIYVELAVRGCA